MFMQIAAFWGREKTFSGRYPPALEICYFEAARLGPTPNQLLAAAISGYAMGLSTDRSSEKSAQHSWSS